MKLRFQEETKMDVRTFQDEVAVSGRNQNGCKDASGRSCGFKKKPKRMYGRFRTKLRFQEETQTDVGTLQDEATVSGRNQNGRQMLRMSIKYDTAVAEFYEIWMLKPSQRVKPPLGDREE